MIKIRVGRRKSDSIRISLIDGSLKLDKPKLEKKNNKVTTEQLLEQNEVKKMLANMLFPFPIYSRDNYEILQFTNKNKSFTFGMVQSLLFIK